MKESLRTLRSRIPVLSDADEEPDPPEPTFGSLRALAAQLLLVTGVGATLDALAHARREQVRVDQRPLDYLARPTPRATYAAVWGPSLIAPLAATAHLTHLARPSDSTTRATRLLDAAVIGMGVATLARDLLVRRGSPRPSLSPLALASAGLLGLAIDRQERAAQEERRRLERRASVVERLVPRRRPKLDRVVVHV